MSKRMTAYAAVYIDRGERLHTGPGALGPQLEACRRHIEGSGGTISLVAIDVIAARNDSDARLERLATDAERIAHDTFADSPGAVTFVVVALRAKSRSHDPRDGNPQSARALAAGSVERRAA